MTASNPAHSVVLITGTDTGVGKTFTGCALGQALRQSGYKVLSVKPLESGCGETASEREDGVALARATGQAEPSRALLRFRDPVAPPEAADREGKSIDFESLVTQIQEFSKLADITLVEGAGGLLSPLTWDKSAVDLAILLHARVLLVAADRLGTINHTLMALAILKTAGLEALGVVLNASGQADASTGSNAAAITRISGVSRVLTVPLLESPAQGVPHVQEILRWVRT